MTPLALCEQWCTLVDDLASQVRLLAPSPQQEALAALVRRFDALIDDLVETQACTLTEDDDAPCPHCGEPACEASCTAALVAQAGLPSCAGWRQTPEAC
jgi:hypothetical protein